MGGMSVEKKHLQVNGGAIMTDENQIRDFLSNGGLLVDRGYTSHEHFAEVSLIHMNGRLYDPLLRRFLNADENIQDMFNTQNYNKYGYVLNNPLMFNDPSGEFIPLLAAAIGWIVSNAAAIATAAAIGAAVGLAAYTVGVLVTGGKWSFVAALKATFWGGISGAVTFGIGSIFSSAAQTFGNALLQAAAHGVAQGTLSLMQGASFKQAFIAGALGSLGASAWGYALNKVGLSQFATSTVGTVAFGALSGGIGAELSGGNFWQGAVIGGVVAGLNHVAHQITDEITKRRQEIVKKAKSHYGSKEWAYDNEKGRFGAGTNKCNLFVDDVLGEAGVYTPDPNGKLAIVGFGTPVTAGQWADPNYNVPGWQVVNSPQAGDIVAISGNLSNATGHVGIMISPTKSIYAEHSIIKISDFGYSSRHFVNYPGNNGYVYRRYVGFPSFNTAVKNSSFKLFGQ